MAEVVRVVLAKDEWTPLIKKLGSRKVERALGDAGYKTALDVQKRLRTASRWSSITGTIHTRRRGNRSKVMMARKGIYLDSMEPHYVSLKRGRNITDWTRRHLPLMKKTGRSRVFKGPRGGIRGGWLYVTPTPWIEKPKRRGLRSWRKHTRTEINRLLRKSR